jgi:hypothetical protein
MFQYGLARRLRRCRRCPINRGCSQSSNHRSPTARYPMMESKTLPSIASADWLSEVLRRCDMLRNDSVSGLSDSSRAAIPSRITWLRLTVGGGSWCTHQPSFSTPRFPSGSAPQTRTRAGRRSHSIRMSPLRCRLNLCPAASKRSGRLVPRAWHLLREDLTEPAPDCNRMAVTAYRRQCGKIVRASDGETILDSGPRSEPEFGPITASSKPSMPRSRGSSIASA